MFITKAGDDITASFQSFRHQNINCTHTHFLGVDEGTQPKHSIKTLR